MKADDYRGILDALPFTGVYVVREDNHELLYFNKRIRDCTPGIEQGMVCHEVWPAGCENCPLLDIGNRQENRNIKYNSPFGSAVDLKAVRILWENKIPAFIMMVTPHMEAADDSFSKKLRGDLLQDRQEPVKPEAGKMRPTVMLYQEDIHDIYRTGRERALIINSLSRLFFASYYIDLDKNQFHQVTNYGGDKKGLEVRENFAAELRTYAEKFVHPDDREEYLQVMDLEKFKENLSPEHPYVAVEYRKTPVGYEFLEAEWIRGTAILAETDGGRPKMVLYVTQDVTEIKRKEEESRKILKDAWEAATRANAAKSDFLSRMSHDIRTPLNAIIGMTAIAKMRLDDRERVLNCLGKITASSRHLLSLINEVLDMSKIESGKIQISEDAFHLSELVQNVLAMVRPAAVAKHQEMVLHVVNVEHENVVGDQVRIQQVFVNILGNAVKYTPEGGHLELEIRERSSREYGYGCYEFVFQDNGIGMEPDFVRTLFDPFSRAEDSRVSKIEGTGLGMAITKNLVQLMNGTIEVESEKNKGTRFTVTLYLKQRNVSLPDMERLSGQRILVVDDDAHIRKTVCGMLSDMGMKAESAAGGREAVERFAQASAAGKRYFAVILDWKMPDVDGLDAAEGIAEMAGEDKPILILAAYDWSRVEEDARRAGIDEFITKPMFKSRLAYFFRRLAGLDSGEPGEKQEKEQYSFAGRRILLVEDNDLNREIAVEILGDMDVFVETAENGKESLEVYQSHPSGYYDLIFMDIQMPVMNGHEAAQAIRRSGREDAQEIPIIAMTANAFAEDVMKSRQAGMNEHISKPLDLEELLQCMERWIG